MPTQGNIMCGTGGSTSGQGVVVMQSLAFFLIFAAFNAAQSLVGSIPAPPGLAAFQFMALYGE